MRRLLIVSQFGASAVLLVSALLVTKSYVAIDDTENGYATDGVVTMRVALDGDAYEDPRQRLGYLDRAANRLRSTGIVEAAGAVSELPVLVRRDGLAPTVAFEVEGEIGERGEARIATQHVVTSGYLETMEIPIVDGRRFTAAALIDGGCVEGVLLSDTDSRRDWPARARRRRSLESGSPGEYVARTRTGPVGLTVVGIKSRR